MPYGEYHGAPYEVEILAIHGTEKSYIRIIVFFLFFFKIKNIIRPKATSSKSPGYFRVKKHQQK